MGSEMPREYFDRLMAELNVPTRLDPSFLYECYCDAIEGASQLIEKAPVLARMPVNHIQLLLYIIHEHDFYLSVHPDLKQEEIVKDEKYEQLILSLALDKYYTNEHLYFQNGSYANKYIPEISTISLYLNFILGTLRGYKHGSPNETLIVDILQKGFSMGKCIVDLLTDGFETEAFSTWRTLHENECILQVIIKYGAPVIERYLKHLKYAVAFRSGLGSVEETDAAFEEIKEGMKAIGLKSKDMKRYIEYGWLLGIEGVMDIPDFKFNFRDGVERCANLREYSKVYEMSSEIAHSSPLLIYSRKNYYYLITLINLYESFFRLEKIFSSLYLSTTPEPVQKQYLQMRNLYFGELSAAYKTARARFAKFAPEEK